MELGLSTFGEIMPDNRPGKAEQARQRVQELLEQIRLADEVGLDVFALGEHHRKDYVISAPEVLLGAAAAITNKIRLSSAVTVLSSTDPVRTFQNFATVDLIANGRAEIMAGRGSFIESFPLFGQHLDDYDALFTEKLDLLLKINQAEKLTWNGRFRPPVENLGIYPRPAQEQIPVWLAVGGTPASAARAGRMNLPMTIAILGGPPDRFVPFVELYRKAAAEAGHDPAKLQLAINVHFYLADDKKEASDDFWPTYGAMMNKIGRERGWSPMGRDQFEHSRAEGPLIVTDPEEAIEKIARLHELFGNTRFLGQLISGDIPHEKIKRSIELFGKVVAPGLKKRLSQ